MPARLEMRARGTPFVRATAAVPTALPEPMLGPLAEAPEARRMDLRGDMGGFRAIVSIEAAAGTAGKRLPSAFPDKPPLFARLTPLCLSFCSGASARPQAGLADGDRWAPACQ